MADDRTFLKEGHVVFHSRDRAAAFGVLDLVGRPAACWYVGRPRASLGSLLGVVLQGSPADDSARRAALRRPASAPGLPTGAGNLE